MKMKLKKDDTVQVVSGKDRGKTGKVLRIDTEKGRVIVQGLNMIRKAVKPRRQNDKGGIIDVEAAIDISNVMVVCKKCGPTRIGFAGEKANKTRICRKCGEAL
ncbi:MAG: 50S ribosomal protein L24 [Spirochaetales bacterium]|nr:50S ribosomal protein L24 [Spirochaetales bacterium]